MSASDTSIVLLAALFASVFATCYAALRFWQDRQAQRFGDFDIKFEDAAQSVQFGLDGYFPGYDRELYEIARSLDRPNGWKEVLKNAGSRYFGNSKNAEYWLLITIALGQRHKHLPARAFVLRGRNRALTLYTANKAIELDEQYRRLILNLVFGDPPHDDLSDFRGDQEFLELLHRSDYDPKN